MNITVCVDGKQFSHKTEGGKLLSALRGLGYSVNAACGGNSKCGKCRVDVEHNGVRKSVLSCEVFTEDGMTVFLPNDSIVDSKPNKPVAQKNGRYGFAVDVGTTTVVVYLVSLTAGEAVLTKSFLNPQRSYGADVVSRIEYCIKNGAEDLCQAITKSVGGSMEQMLFVSGVSNVEEVVITGNTAMLNLFAGEDVSSLGSYPFTPVFLTKKRVFNKYLPRCGALLLPGFSSFVGADIVCDGLAARVDNGCNLIVDLGTNGEILLSHKGKLYVTSVAAGPAFEGANIECGTGGIVGAISSVLPEDGGFKIGVIGGGEPIGICGSGLVDAIAVMLKLNVIDETGAFASDDRRFYLAEKVYLTDKDVRNFQLAKSAVRSGIESILDRCGLTFADVDTLYICGGLGYYINMSSAVATGLIPKELEAKTVNFGNGAGEGAKMCLISSEELDRAEKMAASAEVVELASNPFFTEKFMENMFF